MKASKATRGLGWSRRWRGSVVGEAVLEEAEAGKLRARVLDTCGSDYGQQKGFVPASSLDWCLFLWFGLHSSCPCGGSELPLWVLLARLPVISFLSLAVSCRHLVMQMSNDLDLSYLSRLVFGLLCVVGCVSCLCMRGRGRACSHVSGALRVCRVSWNG